MQKTFIVSARGTEQSKSMDFIAIISVTTVEDFNKRLHDILKTKVSLGKKTLKLKPTTSIMVQFGQSRIKPSNVYLTSPSITDADKEQILLDDWLSVEEARLLLMTQPA
ncbi:MULTISPECIES: hypothetical protein [Vibrio harveyi group]|uniref:hypothetical protein n=1 Tax=Vibrio harveyi group TaxID=717610 RepID=UPI0015F649A0|nr:hypothetical protein [Vibrio alginolyticus]EJE4208705.1 hypothetical protein [Vibrio parahaemolyticus]HDM8060816.1 hypothetical protein [Vibrio harveyi]